MKALSAIVISTVLLGNTAFAQTARQQIGLDIRAINAIAIDGSPVLTLPRHSASDRPIISTSSTTYAITTNEVNRRIMVAIDRPMPVGTSLTVTLGAPAGGSSIDEVLLSTSPQTAVTGISRLNEKNLPIRYSLFTAPGAAIDQATTRTLLLTLVSGA